MEWRSISEPGDWRSIVEGDAPQAPPGAGDGAPPLRISSKPREIVLRGKLATEPTVYSSRRRLRGLSAGLIVALLSRVVGWSASIAGHFILFAILVGVLFMSKPQQDETYVEVGFHNEDGGNQGQLLTPPQPEPKAPEPEPVKEPPKPEPKPEPVPEPPKPEPKPEPEPRPAASETVEDPKPAAIGTGSGTNAAPKPADAAPANVEKDPTAAVAVKRAGEIARLRKGKKRDIVCVAGAYDKVEDVLTKLGVPHTTIDGDSFDTYDLSDCAVLLVNCDDSFGTGTAALAPKEVERINGEIAQLEKRVTDLRGRVADAEKRKDRRAAATFQMQLATAIATLEYKKELVDASEKATKTARRLREFVAKGGYLFTSDWGLTVVEQAFPGSVRRGGDVGPKSVRIAPRKGSEAHFLLEEVFAAKPKTGTTTASKPLKWEIDASSHLIRIDDAMVETVIDSPDLATCKAIAVTFLHDGRKVVSSGSEGSSRPGRVLHILSHFYNQPDKFGDYGLQNMLVNFLVGRLERK